MLLRLSLLCLLLQELLPTTGASESGIIGGKTAKPHSRPYMASLQIRKKLFSGSHVCGGFLIREDFIMTAAHCRNDSKSLTVVLGTNNIKKKEKSSQTIPIKQCYKHPNNSKNIYDFDIMLCKLKRKAKLNKNVNVIQLPKQGESVSDHTKCLISGWGKTNPKRAAAENILWEVTLPIQNNRECKTFWEVNFNNDTMLCTYSKTRKGICQGDSGGPLVCNGKASGIAAFTASPCNADYPNVYTKISYFIPWIKETMKRK